MSVPDTILDYFAAHGWQPRKRCVKCGHRFALDRFSPHAKTFDRHDARCKTCCATYRRTGVWPPSPAPVSHLRKVPRRCAGKECEAKIRRGRFCRWCLAEQRAETIAHAPPLPLSPKVCGLLGCLEVLLFQVNRAGELVLFCGTHGERPAPRWYPGQPGYPKAPRSLHHKSAEGA